MRAGRSILLARGACAAAIVAGATLVLLASRAGRTEHDDSSLLIERPFLERAAPVELEGETRLAPGGRFDDARSGSKSEPGSARTVRVRVVRDVDGGGVARARLSVGSTRADGVDALRGSEGARSDEDGRADLEAPTETGPWLVVVNHDDFAPAELSVSTPDDLNTIRMGRGAAIAGVVMNSNGGPVRDITVVARRLRARSASRDAGPTPPKHAVHRTRADVRGAFEFPHLGAGSYAIDVEDDDVQVDPTASVARDSGLRHALSDAIVATTGDTSVVVRTNRVGLVRVRIIDAETREPIRAPALVSAARPDRVAGVSLTFGRIRGSDSDLDTHALSDWFGGLYGGIVAWRGSGPAPRSIPLLIDVIGYPEVLVDCPILRLLDVRGAHDVAVVALRRNVPGDRFGLISLTIRGDDPAAFRRRGPVPLVLFGERIGGQGAVDHFTSGADLPSVGAASIRWPIGRWSISASGPALRGDAVVDIHEREQTSLEIPLEMAGIRVLVRSSDGEALGDVRFVCVRWRESVEGVPDAPPSDSTPAMIPPAAKVYGLDGRPEPGGYFLSLEPGRCRVITGCPGFHRDVRDVVAPNDTALDIELVPSEITK